MAPEDCGSRAKLRGCNGGLTCKTGIGQSKLDLELFFYVNIAKFFPVCAFWNLCLCRFYLLLTEETNRDFLEALVGSIHCVLHSSIYMLVKNAGDSIWEYQLTLSVNTTLR